MKPNSWKLFRRGPRQEVRRCRASQRQNAASLRLESLEPRLALAGLAGLPDTTAPVVRSVALPPAGTYGGGIQLSFKVNFSEPVKIAGGQSNVTLPIEVGFAMREAQYVSGSGTQSLTFQLTVSANDVDSDGISVGRVNAAAIRDFDFNKPSAPPRIVDRAGNPASNVIPPLNAGGIRVDATGPVVASYGGFATSDMFGRRQVSLQVTFDGPVFVTGKPTVPVTIGGQNRSLAYASGSGTKTLTFAVTLPKGASAAKPAFRGENGLAGEVILLPAGANLNDRFGNSVTTVGGAFGKAYTHAGNRVVVMGAHYEKLGTVSRDELDAIMVEEQMSFREDEIDLIRAGKAEYWKDYMPPDFTPAKYDVDLYRVAYRSTIPEQGDRPTVAYGLLAIPKGALLAVVSYQHGELLLKESAPSQAFSWDKTADTTPVRYGLTQKQLYDSGYETRLNVAQFAGHGYALIAADTFGMGNSIELDGFLAKRSGQQACLDMHAASQKLLESMKLTSDKLFLSGWSTGGLVTLAFQEALESRGMKIAEVSTVAAPSDLELLVNNMIFSSSRPFSTTHVPDSPWVVAIPQFAAFSLAGYGGKPGAALELFGGNYEFARKFSMREFSTLPDFTFRMDVKGDMVPAMIMDGVTRAAQPSQFIDQKLVRDPRAYEKTAFAGLVRDANVGKSHLDSAVTVFYGGDDEVVPEAVATALATWQSLAWGNFTVRQQWIGNSSHRGTFLTAVDSELQWFERVRNFVGAPSSGGDPPPVTTFPGSGSSVSFRIENNPAFNPADAMLASTFANLAYDHRESAFGSMVASTGWTGITLATVPTLPSGTAYSTIAGYGVRDGSTMQSYALAARSALPDGTQRFVIAFEGSNPPWEEPADWIVNAGQYGWSRYYASLMPIVAEVDREILMAQDAGQTTQLIVTGHSLGGAAAMVAYADLFVAPGMNLWPATQDVLRAGTRIYDQPALAAWPQERVRALLNQTTVYTFGAPSFLIEPTKLNVAAAAEAFAGITAGSTNALLQAGIQLANAVSGLTVDDTKLPNLTGYSSAVFQYAHKNSSWYLPGDIVAAIGSRHAGTQLDVNLDNDIQWRYTTWLTYAIPGGTHGMGNYRESAIRSVTGDRLLKSPNEMGSTSPVLPRTSSDQGTDARNDSFANQNGRGGGGNDCFVYSDNSRNSGVYTADGGRGDDVYVIESYGISLTIDGAAQSGHDTLIIDLNQATVQASYIDTNSDGIMDRAAFRIVSPDGKQSSTVTVSGWDRYTFSTMARVEKPNDAKWSLSYLTPQKGSTFGTA